jgi:hypothetical protein
MLMKGSQMVTINATTLKAILSGVGYTDVKNITSTSFGVVVAPTKVDKVIPTLLEAFKAYKPTAVSTREMRVGDKTIYAKNKDQQRGVAWKSHGRGNEWEFIMNLREWMKDYGKPLTICFYADGHFKFVAKRVKAVEHTGAKNIFQRQKADVHLITDTNERIPLSLKDETAGYWESADSYWGQQAAAFVQWALKQRGTSLDDNGAGGVSLRPPIAVPATPKETVDVVFGSDLTSRGAVVVERWRADSFKWNYTADSLDVDCAEVMTSVADVTGKHAIFFEVRNERGRKSKYLMPGLRTLAAMFSNLRGDKVFTLPDRQKIGI